MAKIRHKDSGKVLETNDVAAATAVEGGEYEYVWEPAKEDQPAAVEADPDRTLRISKKK